MHSGAERKIAFLFPGQGSQEIGMGRDLFKDDAYFRTLILRASEFTGEDLEHICLKGPEKKLVLARFLQPLLCAISLGYLRHVREKGIVADLVLGHSLGEITALAAAGVVDDEQAVLIAAKRGALMDEAASRCDGTMFAVLFTPLDQIERLLEEMHEPARIALANDNAPNQVVISGSRELLREFARMIKERNLGKCKELFVAGPWHSGFMQSAREAFEVWAEPLVFHKPRIPLILNATAQGESHPSTIKHLITWQLTSPVYWRECMETVRRAGVSTFLEIGPGRVLSGLVRVNGYERTAEVFNISNLRGVESAANVVTHQSASDKPGCVQ